MKRTRFKLASDLEGFDGPEDDDLLLTVAVLQRRASRAEVDLFDRRFVEDDAFHEKVGPLVEFWHSDVTSAAVAAVDGGSPSPAHRVPIRVPEGEAVPVAGRYRRDQQVQSQGWKPAVNDTLYLGVRIMMAASVLTVVGVGYLVLSVGTQEPERIVRTVRVPASPAAAQAQLGPAPQQPAQQGPAPQQPARQAQAQARLSTAANAILDMRGATVTADSGVSKTIALAGGSTVLIRPGSTLRYSSLPGVSRGSVISVKGEVAIEVTREDFMVQVVSRAGAAMLTPGSYALRCAGVCEAMEVSVARGIASLRPDSSGPAEVRVHLMKGQFGRAFRDSVAAKVSPEAAVGFPLPDSTLAVIRKAP